MKIYIEPIGGLCNRILALDATRQLCNDIKIDFEIIWRNNAECACNYEDVFVKSSHKVRNIWLAKRRFRDNLSEEGFIYALTSRIRSGLNKNYQRRYNNRIILTNHDLVDLKTILIEVEKLLKKGDVYISAYFQYYGKTMVTEDIFNAVLLEKARHIRQNMGNYIACHIRRTDHEKCILDNPLEEYFEKKIQEEIHNNSDVRIYLATDDNEVYKYFYNKYSNNIIHSGNIRRSRLAKEGIQDAVCELLILSGADRIYGSKGSTYSDMAKILNRTIKDNKTTSENYF